MKKDWKGCPPRVTSICVIDDDEVLRERRVRNIGELFPKLTVRGYESIFQAYRNSGRWDYLIIDVSSVAPMMMSDVARAHYPIARFMQEHPGTEVIITSAMSRTGTEEVIAEVRALVGAEALVSYGGQGDWDSGYAGESLKEKLSGMIKPGDMEWTKVKVKHGSR